MLHPARRKVENIDHTEPETIRVSITAALPYTASTKIRMLAAGRMYRAVDSETDNQKHTDLFPLCDRQ